MNNLQRIDDESYIGDKFRGYVMQGCPKDTIEFDAMYGKFPSHTKFMESNGLSRPVIDLPGMDVEGSDSSRYQVRFEVNDHHLHEPVFEVELMEKRDTATSGDSAVMSLDLGWAQLYAHSLWAQTATD